MERGIPGEFRQRERAERSRAVHGSKLNSGNETRTQLVQFVTDCYSLTRVWRSGQRTVPCLIVIHYPAFWRSRQRTVPCLRVAPCLEGI